MANRVNIQVHVADDSIQDAYNDRFGEGTVEVTGFLQPVPS